MAVLAFDVKDILGKVQVEGGQVVGDELEDGNDKEIAAECDYTYNVKSPYDTNILLSVILEDLQKGFLN